jgi:hypothetical protein
MKESLLACVAALVVLCAPAAHSQSVTISGTGTLTEAPAFLSGSTSGAFTYRSTAFLLQPTPPDWVTDDDYDAFLLTGGVAISQGANSWAFDGLWFFYRLKNSMEGFPYLGIVSFWGNERGVDFGMF